MCGYCFEPYAFVAAMRTDSPVANFPKLNITVITLQETPLIAQTLAGISSSPEARYRTAVVFLARLTEILFDQGFDSPAYTSLRQLPDFERLVDMVCQPDQAVAMSTDRILLDARSFAWLFDRKIYLQPGAFAKHLPSLQNAISLLEQYEHWWLDGQGIPWLNFENGETLNKARNDDRLRLVRGALALGVAIDIASSELAGHKATWALVKKSAVYPPDLEGFDLQLQRRAARRIYDHNGIALYAAAMRDIRPKLYQYLALSGRISTEERNVLREVLIQTQKEIEEDQEFSLSRWLIDGYLDQGLPISTTSQQ